MSWETGTDTCVGAEVPPKEGGAAEPGASVFAPNVPWLHGLLSRRQGVAVILSLSARSPDSKVLGLFLASYKYERFQHINIVLLEWPVPPQGR